MIILHHIKYYINIISNVIEYLFNTKILILFIVRKISILQLCAVVYLALFQECLIAKHRE